VQKGEMKQYYLRKYDSKLYLVLNPFVNNSHAMMLA
jgi:hypothetical protein